VLRVRFVKRLVQGFVHVRRDRLRASVAVVRLELKLVFTGGFAFGGCVWLLYPIRLPGSVQT
jgi:hypothetical protein